MARKWLPSLVGAHGLLHLVEEILLQDIRLQRRAGFAGHHHQRLGQVDFVAGGLYLHRIGGIHDVQRGKARLLAKGERQHLGAKAGTAHAQQQNRLEAGRLDIRAQLGISDARSACWRSTMSIQPSHFSSPSLVQRLGSFCQKRAYLVVGVPVGGSQVHGGAKFRGQCESEAHIVIDCA